MDDEAVGLQLLIPLNTPCHHGRSAVVHGPVAHTARQERVLHRGMYDHAEAMTTWHIDSYEKLKPYGFIVHGCVDGDYTTEWEAFIHPRSHRCQSSFSCYTHHDTCLDAIF